jgi:hypothetical protein
MARTDSSYYPMIVDAESRLTITPLACKQREYHLVDESIVEVRALPHNAVLMKSELLEKPDLETRAAGDSSLSLAHYGPHICVRGL